MRTPYQKGYHFEKRVIAHWSEQGWHCFRSAGSKGCADIIACKAGEVAAIQCQVDKYFAPSKRQALLEFCRENGFEAWLAWRESKKLQMEEIGP